MEYILKTHSKEETQRLGSVVAAHLFVGSVVTLSGDLGAGKTTFVGGVAASLGVKEKVNSPTFNIMRCYFEAKIPLYHIDAYRLEEGTNKDIGLEEFIEGNGTCFIEWPIYIQELIPQGNLDIVIHSLGEDNREFIFNTDNASYAALFKNLKEVFNND